MYNWQFPSWPNFSYNTHSLQALSLKFAQELGEVSGLLYGRSKTLQDETLMQFMLTEAIKTSEIEGEFISREDIMSSLRNNLGLNQTLISIKDKRATNITALMLEVKKSFDEPLTLQMLQHWHRTLMAHALHVNPGAWRTGTAAMQIISGAYGAEVVHFEAPPSAEVPNEMEAFVQWFNTNYFPVKGEAAEAILKAAVAHLYFESIHPFEDGNGRIGRAIAELALSQSIGYPLMLSLSKIIERDKNRYYEALKEAQRTMDITAWIKYFGSVILDAQRDAREVVHFTLRKAKFFDSYKDALNERQLKVIHKMLEKGAEGFTGGMTAKKYISITKTSKATATRDLLALQSLGVLVQEGAGRSVRYHLSMNPQQ
jgi:Fic family protein